MESAALTIRVWNKTKDIAEEKGDMAERLVPHLEHVRSLCAQGYVAGQIVDEDFDGWWEIKSDDKE